MLKVTSTFSGFSVDNIEAAKHFYGDLLGLRLEDRVGGTMINLTDSANAWMYEKNDHQPAAYTMLDFVVEDIDEAFEALASQGIKFEHYPESPQDENGILRGKENNMGPNIAWFKDPAGNILAILEN